MKLSELIDKLEKIRQRYGDDVIVLVQGRLDVGGRDIARVCVADNGPPFEPVVLIEQD